jgi:hypothetical protein
MGLPNKNLSEFDLHIADQEKLIGAMRVSTSRSFGEGYDGGVADTTAHFQDKINNIENERDLFEEMYQAVEAKLRDVSSQVGKALNKCK